VATTPFMAFSKEDGDEISTAGGLYKFNPV
jgi:uncharacterized protein (DUF2237 family)